MSANSLPQGRQGIQNDGFVGRAAGAHHGGPARYDKNHFGADNMTKSRPGRAAPLSSFFSWSSSSLQATQTNEKNNYNFFEMIADEDENQDLVGSHSRQEENEEVNHRSRRRVRDTVATTMSRHIICETSSPPRRTLSCSPLRRSPSLVVSVSSSLHDGNEAAHHDNQQVRDDKARRMALLAGDPPQSPRQCGADSLFLLDRSFSSLPSTRRMTPKKDDDDNTVFSSLTRRRNNTHDNVMFTRMTSSPCGRKKNSVYFHKNWHIQDDACASPTPSDPLLDMVKGGDDHILFSPENTKSIKHPGGRNRKTRISRDMVMMMTTRRARCCNNAAVSLTTTTSFPMSSPPFGREKNGKQEDCTKARRKMKKSNNKNKRNTNKRDNNNDHEQNHTTIKTKQERAEKFLQMLCKG